MSEEQKDVPFATCPDWLRKEIKMEQAPTITAPEYSEWQCELFGGGPTGMILRPLKGLEPNWFWRRMQYLCFGNKWVRVKK
jgi:hypothetical protein